MKSAKEMLGIAKEKTMEQVSMLKTKEGRKAFVAKAKTMAMTTKDKTVTLWKSGIKGKVILCGVTLLVLWLFFPSCDSDSKKADGLTAKSGGSSARLKLKKLRDTDALFYEGSFPQGTSEIEFEDQYNTEGRYKSVAPNVIVLPDTVSLKNLCGSFNPDLEDYRKKGVAYFNDPNGTYYCVVVHVGRGYVVVKPDSTSMYGHCYGYIETDDEYVEGARLKLGFYTYLGTTKKVPLVNGSSHTMYAYRKMDDGIAAELVKAIEYNGKACEAAENENANRNYKAGNQKAKDDEKFVSNIDKGVDELFRKALAEYDDIAWKSHIHVSGALKGKVKISDAAKWRWIVNGQTQEMAFADFKKKMEKEGGTKYLKDNGTPLESLTGMFVANTTDAVLEHANGVFKSRRYQLKIDCAAGTGSFVCYKVEADSEGAIYSIIPVSSESDMTFQIYNSLAPFEKQNIQFYIIDRSKDADMIAQWEETTNSPETAKKIIKMFNKKYGK